MTTNIATTTMIVAVTTGLPRQMIKLKKEAEEIATKAHAYPGTVKASMHYFRYMEATESGKSVEVDGLKPLRDIQNEYKEAVHLLARYPYAGNFYLAPAVVIDQLLAIRNIYEGPPDSGEGKIQEQWLHWADHVYPGLAESAPSRMGHLFANSRFPSLMDCSIMFKCKMTLLPLAEKDQVARITLISPTSRQLLMDHADSTSKEAIAELHRQLWKDLMDPLEQVVKVFEKDKPKVYDSLLGNLMEIVNVIPQYTELCQDPALVESAAKVKEAFGQMQVSDLRKSDEARTTALTTAKQMVAQFKPFSRQFN